MRFTKVLVGAMLGATALTAGQGMIPQLSTPAQASFCNETCAIQTGTGDDDDLPESGGFGGDWGGDWGGNGVDHGDYSDGGSSGSIGGSVDLGGSGGQVDTSLPTVVIYGSAQSPTGPGSAVISQLGGGESGEYAPIVISRGIKERVRSRCMRNSGPSQIKVSESVSYQVSYQVSSNISGTAMQMLTASLGVQLNTQIGRTFTTEVTIEPGSSWAMYVEYQTVVYAIPNSGLGGNRAEFVNVVAPTGVVIGGTCDQ